MFHNFRNTAEFIKMYEILKIVLALAICCLQCGKAQNARTDRIGLYSKRYERIDIDTILSSRRLVTNYVECLLNKKPCPPEGKDLKRILPEALRTKCSRCWPSQKEGAIKVITKLYYDYPDQYNALRAKWDPTGEYHRRFEEYLRDQQFNSINSNGNSDGFDTRGAIPDQSQISISTTRAEGVNANRAAGSTTQPPPQTPTPTVRNANPTRRVTNVISLTQRPIRQNGDTGNAGVVLRDELPSNSRPVLSDEVPTSNGGPILSDELPSGIGTRFGGGDDEPVEISTRSKVNSPPATRGTTTKTPPVVSYDVNWGYDRTQLQTRNPILNLINRLSWKFTNTAEFFAGMVRDTLKRT